MSNPNHTHPFPAPGSTLETSPKQRIKHITVTHKGGNILQFLSSMQFNFFGGLEGNLPSGKTQKSTPTKVTKIQVWELRGPAKGYNFWSLRLSILMLAVASGSSFWRIKRLITFLGFWLATQDWHSVVDSCPTRSSMYQFAFAKDRWRRVANSKMSAWQLDLSNHQDSCRLCFDKSPGNDRPLSAAESCRLRLFVVPVKSWKTWRSGQIESYENRSEQRTWLYDCDYDYGYDFVHACGYDCHYDYAYAYDCDCDSDYVCLWLWLGLWLHTIFHPSSSLCTEQPGWILGGKNLAEISWSNSRISSNTRPEPSYHHQETMWQGWEQKTGSEHILRQNGIE